MLRGFVLAVLISTCSEDKCDTNYFQCNDGTCIPAGMFCDHEFDCADGEDEVCFFKNCINDEYECADGWCISGYSVCDGHEDCSGGDDEDDCP